MFLIFILLSKSIDIVAGDNNQGRIISDGMLAKFAFALDCTNLTVTLSRLHFINIGIFYESDFNYEICRPRGKPVKKRSTGIRYHVGIDTISVWNGEGIDFKQNYRKEKYLKVANSFFNGLKQIDVSFVDDVNIDNCSFISTVKESISFR